MAEGWTISRKDRHNSSCEDGCRCKNGSMPVCRYYARGYCAYAESCRFLHVDAKNRVELNITSDVQTQPTKKGYGNNEMQRTLKPENIASSGEKSREKSHLTDEWVNAPEFVPSADWNSYKPPKTYAQAVSSLNKSPPEEDQKAPLCPYSKEDECKFGSYCLFTHGLLCDICNLFCLHPTDDNERKKHISECIKKQERDMEISFAIQRSKDKTCGICFEIIMEKALWDQKFGILPNCNHCFCLTCIRKWRQAKNFDSKIIRACPECRVSSDFVCPSAYWVDCKEDKEKLICDYKDALSSKDCKYFRQGQGKCPFGNKCFYLHAYPDGTKADVGPPVRQRRQNADGEIEVFQHIFLWDFLEGRDSRWRYNIEDLDDIFAFFSDSDDSDYDWSDYDFFL